MGAKPPLSPNTMATATRFVIEPDTGSFALKHEIIQFVDAFVGACCTVVVLHHLLLRPVHGGKLPLINKIII